MIEGVTHSKLIKNNKHSCLYPHYIFFNFFFFACVRSVLQLLLQMIYVILSSTMLFDNVILSILGLPTTERSVDIYNLVSSLLLLWTFLVDLIKACFRWFTESVSGTRSPLHYLFDGQSQDSYKIVVQFVLPL